MGGVLSRPTASGGRGSDVELSGAYQRFDAPDADVAWVAGRREGCVDYTPSLAPLMGGNVTNRSLMVRVGSPALLEVQRALAGLPADIAGAWTTVMVQGTTREGSEHFASLVRTGALDLNHPRDARSSLLHQLAREGSEAPGHAFTLQERFALLRNAGADLDLSAEGATPLHAAVEAGNQPAVDALLAAGASPNAHDAAGRTPLDLALAGQARAAADPEGGGAHDAEAMLTTLQAYAAFAGTNVAPQRLGLVALGQRAAHVLTLTGAASTMAGVGTGLMTVTAMSHAIEGIDHLSAAQSRYADAIAEADRALVEGMSKMTAAQVGPIESLTAEAAEAQLRSCVAKESLEDLLPFLAPQLGLKPILQPAVPTPRPTMYPRGAEEAKFSVAVEDGRKAANGTLDKTAAIKDGIRQPGKQPAGPLDNQIERLPEQTASRLPASAANITDIRDTNLDDLAGKLPDTIDSKVPQPARTLPDRVQNESFPCRDEFDRYRLALYQSSYRGHAALGLERARHTYAGVKHDGIVNSSVLLGSGGGLMAIGALMSYWLNRRAQARPNNG